jgi:hypothetical protein
VGERRRGGVLRRSTCPGELSLKALAFADIVMRVRPIIAAAAVRVADGHRQRKRWNAPDATPAEGHLVLQVGDAGSAGR